jgi:5-deoxy-D-glucuronate isomerase
MSRLGDHQAAHSSSRPPCNFDLDDTPREAVLEKGYYYRQRPLRRAGQSSACTAVKATAGTGSGRCGPALELVTDGYHPFVAAHSCEAYYVNELAGDWRAMARSDYRDLARTPTAWSEREVDPHAMALVG